MNRLEEDPLLGIPSYQQLIVYRDYERKLTEEIEQNSFDSELQKLGYQDALDIVLSGIAQVISEPEFQSDTAAIGINALQSYMVNLESTTDQKLYIAVSSFYFELSQGFFQDSQGFSILFIA
jgi:hypothetical protein